jgi:hypothetical protein
MAARSSPKDMRAKNPERIPIRSDPIRSDPIGMRSEDR